MQLFDRTFRDRALDTKIITETITRKERLKMHTFQIQSVVNSVV